MSHNLFYHNYTVNRQTRNDRNGHGSLVVWFTGLSGSGKSTISNIVEHQLFEKGINVYSLDGDNIRLGINKGLGFSSEDRTENLRRIGEVAKLFVEAGTVIIAAFVSPLEKDRDMLRSIIGSRDFVEVYVNTPLEECERRDVKGLYAKARKGEIGNFTGISAPYEAPARPDIEIKTEELSASDAASKITEYIIKQIKKQ